MAVIQIDEIQGNCLGGFNKDHQVNILLKITDVKRAHKTLGAVDDDDSILGDVAASTSELVLIFNNQFKALTAEGIDPETVIAATWTNITFTHSGLEKLGASELAKFPKAFREGMLARAAHIGDIGENEPGKWEELQTPPNTSAPSAADWGEIDIMVIVASDIPDQVNEQVLGSRMKEYLDAFNAHESGLKVLRVIHGEVREGDESGHEMFGFKDGVSQPGVRTIDLPDDPVANPNQGHPGQDLLYPGEFVLGYPRQIPKGTGEDGPNPHPGVIAGEAYLDTDPAGSQTVLPHWARNGSFVVFRRLYQDVKGFQDFVEQTAGALGITTDLMGAKIVGRYKSGAPLERIKAIPASEPWPPDDDPAADPSEPSHLLATSDTLNLDFEYQDKDGDGHIVPRAAHIRKAYPRDEIATGQTARDAESQTQTHRLLRRGIPFGASYEPGQTSGPTGVDAPRGLLFACYQSDIERQYEFVQISWVDNPNFPQHNDGQDPLITNSTASGPISGCPFHPKGNKSACPVDFKHFVKTRGGGYFFSPSISAIKAWFPKK